MVNPPFVYGCIITDTVWSFRDNITFVFDYFSAAGLTAQRFPQFNSCAMTPRRRMQSGCVFNFQERKDSINQTSADFYAYSSSFSYKKEKSERISHWEDTVRIILIFGPSDWTWTSGLLNPIQARYQTSPHPDFQQLCYTTTRCEQMQVFFYDSCGFSAVPMSR